MKEESLKESGGKKRCCRRRGVVALIVGLVFAGVTFLTPVWSNTFLLLSDRVYFIPKESSIFSFRVIEMNGGSGDWWSLGQDRHFYYAYINSDGILYRAFPKSRIADCPGFDVASSEKWCAEFVVNHSQ